MPTDFSITNNIRNVRAHIPAHVTLVCVSKFHPVEAIREAYDAGERHFGESRVQELKQKIPLLPDDIHWHFIGHNALNEEAIKQGIIQNILLEIHVAKEETKTGLSPSKIESILDHSATVWPGLRIVGLMAMATNTDDKTEIRRCFNLTASLASDLYSVSKTVFQAKPILSMGMSDDYRIAIECGSNMVRIGSTIFGERTYK